MADVGVRVTVSGAEDGQRKLDDFGKSIGKIEDGGLDATEALKLFAGVAAGALATATVYAAQKLYSAFEETRRLGDEMNNLSQRTGIAVEKLSGGLRLAAETTGSSVEGLATGMNMLNRAISEAADGTGKQADAFKRLGIDVHDSTGKLKSADQVLNEIATAFAGAEDGAVKTEIAMTLLGRSGAVLIPLLNQGADGLSKLEREAKLAGITLDKETAEAASKLNENLRILSAYGQGFWVQVASPMIDGLAKITGAIRQARLEGEGWLAAMHAGAKATFEALFLPNAKQQLDTLSGQEKRAITEINRLEAVKKGAGRGQWSGIHEQNLQSLYGQLQNIYAQQGALEGQAYVESPQFAADLAGPKVALAPPPPKPGKAGSGERDAAYREEMQRINALKGFEIQAIHETEKEQERAYREEMQRIGAVRSTEIKAINERQAEDKKAMDAIRRTHDRTAQSEVRQINETTYLFKEHKMAALEELERKYIEMGDAGAKGLQRVRGDMEALKGTTKATGVIVQDVGFDMGKVWQGVHTGLTQAIGDIARYALGIGGNIKSLGEALKGFFLGIVNSVIDMFAKIAANEIFRWIFGGGGATAGSGLLGSLVSGAASGATGSGGGGGLMGNVLSGANSLLGGGLGNTAMNVGNALGIGVGFNAAAIEGAVGIAELGLIADAGTAAASAGAMGGAMAGVGAAIPWVGAALAVASMLGLFDEGGPKPQEFGIINGHISQNNYLQGFDAMWQEADRMLFNGGVYAPGVHTGYGGVAGSASETLAAYLGKIEPSRIGAFPLAWFEDWSARSKAMGYAMGTADMIVSKPTFFSAGEVGTERVTVSPIGASHRGGGGGISVSVNGFSMIDAYAARRLAYELKRVLAS